MSKVGFKRGSKPHCTHSILLTIIMRTSQYIDPVDVIQ